MKIAIHHKKILFSCICICGLRCSPPVIGRGRRYFFWRQAFQRKSFEEVYRQALVVVEALISRDIRNLLDGRNNLFLKTETTIPQQQKQTFHNNGNSHSTTTEQPFTKTEQSFTTTETAIPNNRTTIHKNGNNHFTTTETIIPQKRKQSFHKNKNNHSQQQKQPFPQNRNPPLSPQNDRFLHPTHA